MRRWMEWLLKQRICWYCSMNKRRCWAKNVEMPTISLDAAVPAGLSRWKALPDEAANAACYRRGDVIQ